MRPHAFALVLTVAVSLPAHAFDTSGYEFERTMDGVNAPGLYRADIDAELYRHSRQEALGDLRIVGPDGKDVPWVMRKVPPQQQPKSWPARILDSSPQNDGSTQVTVDVGSGQKHTEITLTVDAQNDWQRQARIESSDDNQHWAPLADGAWLFHYHAPHFVTATTIHYATSPARYLRVTLLANGQPPIGVTAATVGYVPAEAHQPMRLLPAVPPQPIADAGSATANAWTIDLGEPGVPIAELALSVDDPTFARRAFVATADQPPNWMPLATTLLWRAGPAAAGAVAQENVRIPTGGTRVRWLRLDVVNGTDRPLALRQVSPAYVAEELVFRVTASGSPFTLYIGSDGRPATYTAREVYKGEEPKLTAALGTLTPNNGFAQLSSAKTAKLPKQPKQGTHGFTALVIVAIIIVVILIVIWVGGRRKR